MKVSRRKSKSRGVIRVEPAPIIPKPHRTDHILQSYFKDIFAKAEEKDLHLSSSNGTIATTTDVDIENTAAKDETLIMLKHKLEVYDQLEKHLQQARAKALSEEEQHLAKMREDYPMCDNAALLRRPSLISAHLDGALLKEHGLLSPSECLPAVPTRNLPPRVEIPSYLNATVTSELHARVKQSNICHKEKDYKEEQQVPSWKNTLSSDEREREKAALLELQRKVNFLHNPRLSAHKHSNTASHGPAKIRKGKKEKEKDTNLFAAEPSKLVFTNYAPGKNYEQFIEFRNISGASRQLRIVPPKSQYFKIKIANFPNAEGIIAPGMSCSYSVQFLPDSLADFDDQIKVVTQNGECLTVKLKGFRPPPELSVPSELQCGHCLVGDNVTLTFPCLNNGGEGNFRLMTKEQEEEEEGDLLKLGSFTVSPTAFHLAPGLSLDLKVEFCPDRAELYNVDFLMACDNGQMRTFTITGTGDMVSVECVHVTTSANSVLTANEYAKTTGHSSSFDSADCQKESESAFDCVIQFGHNNPGVAVYKTVVIKNYSGVKLSYQWQYYYPCTELSSTSTISPLVPVTTSPFSLEGDCSGLKELLPGETKLIPLAYTPLKVGGSHVIALMELEGVPLPSLNPDEEGWSWVSLDSNRISPLCLELKGIAEPYEIELSPPLICLADGLPPSTDKTQTVKVINHSICSVSFEWNSENSEQCAVSIEPSSGTILPGGYQCCECVIRASNIPGPFSIPLHCTILNNNDDSNILHIKGQTKWPVVTVCSPSIQYGLIQLGHTSSQSLTLMNESNGPVNFKLKQLVCESDSDVMDYSCLVFSPDHGSIPPCTSVTVDIGCGPMDLCGRLRSTVEVSVSGKRTSLIPVSAEIQRPSLVLEQASVYLQSCYIGVPHNQQITIINRGLLPAHYQWIDSKYDHCKLTFSPCKGTIGAKETANITLTSTWNTEGYHTGVLALCKVEAMSEPLLLAVSSRVMGLTVHYRVEGQTENKEDITNDDELVLNFGASSPTGCPQELCLVVTNSSAVSTKLSASVQHFAAPHNSQTASFSIVNAGNSSYYNNSRLLQSTENIINPLTKTLKQKELDINERLLSDGRGCCFTLSPSQCDLLPFQSQRITITAHSDMWGSYSDHLICKVDGIKSRYIPITYHAIGSPIFFQTTATFEKTTVRFGSQPAEANLVKRNLKLINTSLSDIRIDWRVFNYSPDDDKLIDLITYIGHPFPRLTDNQPLLLHETEENGTHPSFPLVRAIIQPHEGVQSPGYPFTIHPQQMTISAKSSAVITLCFDPSIQSHNEFGEHISSYILGYYSLDHKPPVGCVHSSGYDTSQLRIDITASVQHPKLVLESDTDDDNLAFIYVASELIKNENDILSSVSLSHQFTLTNPTDAILTFKIIPLSDPYSVYLLEGQSNATLKPHQKITGEIKYCIEHSEVIQQQAGMLVSTNKMIVQFNNGAIQKFPVQTRVHLPNMSIYPSSLEYGIVYLTQSRATTVQLRNDSHSQCLWQASIPQDCIEIIQVTPKRGMLGSISSDEDCPCVTTLHITFTPRTEIQYSVDVVLTEILTHSSLSLKITGQGSADEGVMIKKKRL